MFFTQQFVEQRTVMDHRFAQIFRTGLASVMAKRNVVRRSIVVDDLGMVNGDVSGPLLEVRNWIAARLHDVGNKAVSQRDRAPGVVDKLRLHFVPAIAET